MLNHYRELQVVGLQCGSVGEWAPEGELKRVGEPEKILRYQESAYVSMCEWMYRHQAGWHRRRLVYSCPSISWDRSFFICKKLSGS